MLTVGPWLCLAILFIPSIASMSYSQQNLKNILILFLWKKVLKGMRKLNIALLTVKGQSHKGKGKVPADYTISWSLISILRIPHRVPPGLPGCDESERLHGKRGLEQQPAQPKMASLGFTSKCSWAGQCLWKGGMHKIPFYWCWRNGHTPLCSHLLTPLTSMLGRDSYTLQREFLTVFLALAMTSCTPHPQDSYSHPEELMRSLLSVTVP